MQKFGADSNKVAYALSINEGEVRKMLFQLSVIKDLASRYVFYFYPDLIYQES
jgi:hypothetical protein